MKGPSAILSAAGEVERFCESKGWRFCFIGGVAVQRWADPRYTQDVDLTLLTGYGRETEFIDVFLSAFPGRRPDSREFALSTRVLLAQTQLGVPIDLALGAIPFEEASIVRSSKWQIDQDLAITTCSAEDLIVHKIFASRDRDWGDIESVLVRQFGRLDLGLVEAEVKPLLELKEDSDAFSRFERLLAKVTRRVT